MNDEVLKKLSAAGCNIDEALERFLNDEELYLSCFEDLVNDPAVEALGKALSDKNISSAFELSHSLKGVTANMSVMTLYNAIVKIVESLRSGKIDGLTEIYNDYVRENDKIKSIISSK